MRKPAFPVRAAFTLCVLVASWANVAEAQTAEEEARARQYTSDGNAHFGAGRYAEAEKAFREAFALSGRPGFLWNMAQCARMAGARSRAFSLYKRYLKEAPNGSERDQAQRWVSLLAPPEAKRAPVPPALASSASPTASRKTPQNPALVFDTRPNAQANPSPYVYEQWWFWAGAGAVVTGVVAAILWSSAGDSSPAPQPEPDIRW